MIVQTIFKILNHIRINEFLSKNTRGNYNNVFGKKCSLKRSFKSSNKINTMKWCAKRIIM
jgi:hypothetical protein